jgi:hypothetical protein
MKTLLKLLSYLGLLLTLAPAFGVFYGLCTFAQHTTAMLVGMALWFTTAPFWLSKTKHA